MPTAQVSAPASGDGAVFLRSGKVKDVYRVRPEVLEFRFSNRISVFDQVIPNEVPAKGRHLANASAHWFRMCRRLGIPNHFYELTQQGHMQVAEMEIQNPLNGKRDVPGRFINLEFILRHYIAGSMWDRIKAGKVTPEMLGFPSGHKLQQHEKLPEPLFEVTTKFEDTDRPVTGEEALEIGGITAETMEAAKELVIKTDEHMQAELKNRGVIHVDGKKELALDEESGLMLVDTFGTADEDRFWYQEDLDAGAPMEHSKEIVRQYYRRTGHKAALDEARKEHVEEPPIPALPANMVVEVSKAYGDILRRLTGEDEESFLPRQVAPA